MSDFSNSKISLKDWIYQLLTNPTDGILRRFSGSRWISFMILDNLTGSSFRRNTNDLCSHADNPKKKKRKDPNQNKTHVLLINKYLLGTNNINGERDLLRTWIMLRIADVNAVNSFYLKKKNFDIKIKFCVRGIDRRELFREYWKRRGYRDEVERVKVDFWENFLRLYWFV